MGYTILFFIAGPIILAIGNLILDLYLIKEHHFTYNLDHLSLVLLFTLSLQR